MAHASERSEPSSLEELDKISTLPTDVVKKILACLPTEEAGRTSILSTNWRRTWESIPGLVVHNCNNADPVQTIRVVDEILALRNHPIHKFDLLISENRPHAIDKYCHDAFDRWIEHLSRTKIWELSLNMRTSGHSYLSDIYKIHSSLFSCSSLRFLCIKNCRIQFPVERQEFKLVHTLELHYVCISGDEVEMLTSCCPMLDNFIMRECRYPFGPNPRISAPNLKKIHINGWFHFLQLRTPKLLHLRMDFNAMKEDLERMQRIHAIDLNEFFRGLPNLEKLELRDEFAYNFPDAEFATGKFLLQNLKELWLGFKYFREEEVKFIAPLLHNAPNLRVLHLQNSRFVYRHQNFWKSMNAQDFSLQSLHIMNIYFLCCADLETLPFIKFVLGSASNLHKLVVKNFEHYCSKRPTLCLQKKVSYLRVPSSAQIIFEESVLKEESCISKSSNKYSNHLYLT